MQACTSMPAVIGDKSAYQPLLPVRALTNKSPLRWNQPTGAARSLLRTRNGGPRSGMPSLAPDTKDSGMKTEGYTSLSLFSVLRDADINPALVSHRIASSVNGLKWALPFFSRLRQSRATVTVPAASRSVAERRTVCNCIICIFATPDHVNKLVDKWCTFWSINNHAAHLLASASCVRPKGAGGFLWSALSARR
jgi:hypothetical protein